ncbi:MAG: hypothetical protein GY832_24760 [Chloroflexi bacterium]|nr:hypothetical protein [Chloroflexota bacterium]
MKHLNREALERAREFLVTQARPLERALFEHRFEGATVDGALAELARFQNQDGGFGQALESDLRTPSSSALATAIGLRMLRELGCPADHQMVRNTVAYLITTYDDDAHVWRVVPPDTNAFPHAPWWHDEDGSLTRLFSGFQIIPRALILGSLHHYSTLVPAAWLDEVTEETVKYIETVEVLGGGGGSDLEYAIYLAKAQNLLQHYATRLKARIQKAIPAVVVRDLTQWDTYCITPLRAVPSPQTFGADLISDELQMHLDYQITHQTPEGTWDPPWSWGGNYPEVWAQAKLEWRGLLTLETLTQLDAFGRIEA